MYYAVHGRWPWHQLRCMYPSVVFGVSPLPLFLSEVCNAPVSAATIDDLFGGFVDKHFHIMPSSFPRRLFSPRCPSLWWCHLTAAAQTFVFYRSYLHHVRTYSEYKYILKYTYGWLQNIDLTILIIYSHHSVYVLYFLLPCLVQRFEYISVRTTTLSTVYPLAALLAVKNSRGTRFEVVVVVNSSRRSPEHSSNNNKKCTSSATDPCLLALHDINKHFPLIERRNRRIGARP